MYDIVIVRDVTRALRIPPRFNEQRMNKKWNWSRSKVRARRRIMYCRRL